MTEKEEKWSFEYVHQQQDECQVLSHIKTCLKSKRASLKTTDRSFKPFEKELSRCFIGNDGVLRRKSIDGNLQIIIPQKLTIKVLQMMHDDQGHFGYSKTLQRAQKRYFWPRMSFQIDEWCKKCKVCQQRRNPVPANRAPLQPITTHRPGELVTMHGYCRISTKYRWISLLSRNGRSFFEMFPLRNHKAETVAKKVFDGWIPAMAFRSNFTTIRVKTYQRK